MIINLLTQKRWALSGSGFSNVENSPTTGSFSSGSLSSFQIPSTSGASGEFVFSSLERNKLSYIEFDQFGYSGWRVIVSHSIDGNDWEEFPFKERYLSSATSAAYYQEEANRLPTDPKVLYRHYSTSGTPPEQLFVSTQSSGVFASGDELHYVWQRVNPLTKEIENLCEGLNFVHLKISVFNIDAVSGQPFSINALRVYIDEQMNDNLLNSQILVLRAQDFFNSRAYEEQPFLKDVSMTYMQMLGASGQESNNFYTKTLALDSRMFLDFFAIDDNDFSFRSVALNPITNQYVTSGPGTMDVYHANNKIFQELNVQEFAQEWKAIVDHLEYHYGAEGILKANQDMVEYKKSFILFLLKHINLLNSMKGTKFLIEYIINLYASFFGYNVLSVVEDQNFVYRISASIPTADWNTMLKTIVHPCGWDVIYNEIDSSMELQFEPGMTNQLNRRYFPALGALDCLSYFEGDYFNAPILIKKLSTLRNSNLADQINGAPSGTESDPNWNPWGPKTLQTLFTDKPWPQKRLVNNSWKPYRWQTKYSESKLQRKLSWESKATVDVDYSSSSISPSTSATNHAVPIGDPINIEMSQKKNYRFVHDRINNTYQINFGQPGVAIKYMWSTYLGNALKKMEFTPQAEYFVDLDTIQNSRHFRVELALQHQGWSQTIFGYRQNYERFRQMHWLWSEKNHRRKMLNVWASDSRGTSDNGISFDSFDSEALYTSTGTAKATEYDFLSSAISGSFMTEFVSGSPLTISASGTQNSQKYFTLKYKKPGVFSKYIWTISVSGIPQRSITTYFNEVTFNVNNLPETKVQLTVESESSWNDVSDKNNFTYTIPTLLTLI